VVDGTPPFRCRFVGPGWSTVCFVCLRAWLCLSHVCALKVCKKFKCRLVALIVFSMLVTVILLISKFKFLLLVFTRQSL
jgi:hypothetical protein